MTCIYNEGAAGTSLLDGHNVSRRVCVCVYWGVGLNTKIEEVEGKSPVAPIKDTHTNTNLGLFCVVPVCNTLVPIEKIYFIPKTKLSEHLICAVEE